MDAFDVIVIGAGPAGEVAAGRCAEGGLTVAVVERELVGGECSFWGCMPSKTLLRPGEALAAARRVPGAAEAITGSLDLAAALARRDAVVASWDDAGQLPWLEQRGIVLIRGTARLAGERTVEVTASDGATRTVRAQRAVVLATGTAAAIPPVEGLREVRTWSNRDVTAIKDVPRRLLVLGGGAIGVEMAQAIHRLGADEVTVIEGMPRLLPREEPFAGEEVQRAFEREGIRVVVGVRLAGVSRDGTDGPVTAVTADGQHLVADELLVAVGRVPATRDLGVETVGLAPGRYVEVDDRLRAVDVAGGWLYAVGDCNGRALLTHMGKYQGRIAADVILGKDAVDRSSITAVPRVTFTDPQVCAVGLTEQQAREQGREVRVVTYGTGDVAAASTLGRGIHGTSCLVVDTDRQVIIGATFTGPFTQELLHSATVAIVGRVPLTDLWHAVPSFPTLSEVWLRLLETYGL